MASAAAALVARARREIQHRFFEADAVRPDRAISFEPSNGFERRIFDRYLRRGIVRQGMGGQYWMDVAAYDVDLRRRHRILRNALLTLILVLVVAMLAGALQLPR
ncbi:MAG: hypothetical protein V4499_09875 [Pseudomonadota bacterium]|jgi:hypothetical protein